VRATVAHVEGSSQLALAAWDVVGPWGGPRAWARISAETVLGPRSMRDRVARRAYEAVQLTTTARHRLPTHQPTEPPASDQPLSRSRPRAPFQLNASPTTLLPALLLARQGPISPSTLPAAMVVFKFALCVLLLAILVAAAAAVALPKPATRPSRLVRVACVARVARAVPKTAGVRRGAVKRQLARAAASGEARGEAAAVLDGQERAARALSTTDRSGYKTDSDDDDTDDGTNTSDDEGKSGRDSDTSDDDSDHLDGEADSDNDSGRLC